jgi:enterobactin synthetase component D
VPLEVLARLQPAEHHAALGLEGFRQMEWVGARLAWHAAASRFGLGPTALLSGTDRAPVPPSGVAVSLTHKRDLAVALVGPSSAGALGVDLEGEGRERLRIAERVLREEELAQWARVPVDRRWLELMVRFATKEAIYKAVHPTLQRYVGFDEARVEVELAHVPTSEHLPDFSSVEQLSRPRAELFSVPKPTLECVVEHAGARVLAAVRATW